VLDQLDHKPDVVFSTDMYVKDSIKTQERQCRGCSAKILLEGVNTRKLFLQNDEIKRQLFKLMLCIWSSEEAAKRLVDRKVILVVEGQAFLLTSTDGHSVDQVEIESLNSKQEETDTRVVLYLCHAQQEGYKYAVVHSPDSNIFFILLCYAHKLDPLVILFVTGSREKRRLLNITEIAQDLGPRFCAYKGKWKVNPLMKLEKKPKFQNCFAQLSVNLNVEEKLIDKLEEFTCIMYGYPRIKRVRGMMLRKMVGEGEAIKSSSKVNFSTLQAVPGSTHSTCKLPCSPVELLTHPNARHLDTAGLYLGSS
jgi:hypothetical protein